MSLAPLKRNPTVILETLLGEDVELDNYIISHYGEHFEGSALTRVQLGCCEPGTPEALRRRLKPPDIAPPSPLSLDNSVPLANLTTGLMLIRSNRCNMLLTSGIRDSI